VPPRRRITLYTKPDCPLCDHAKAKLARARIRRAFDLEEIDVTTDPALEARYGLRIPVVAIDGREAFEHRVILDELLRRLDEAGDYGSAEGESKA
jgi:glutaredoxin